jgi:choline-sulfatase
MNILLITDDQHRYDFFGFYGRFPIQTPAFDRLRREGVYLPNHFSNCPVCMPTRFTWQYGLYAEQAGGRLLDNHLNWPTHLPSLPQRLKQTGYRTALMGKLHSHAGLIYRNLRQARQNTLDRGYDELVETSGRSLSHWYDCDWTYYLQGKGLLDDYRTELDGWHDASQYGTTCLRQDDTVDAFTFRAAHDYLSNYNHSEPFFLHLSFCSPHVPIYVSPDTRHPYDPATMPKDFPAGDFTQEQTRQHQECTAAYASLVSELDEYMGKLFTLLEDKGILDDTLIVFGTDHGDMLGEHGLYGKQTWYDGSTRTPVLMRLPGKLPAGLTLAGMTEAVDLPLTLIEAACGEQDPQQVFPGTPGRSFWQAACSADDPLRDCVYSACFTGENAWRMLRTPEWKYVYTPASGEMLFDLHTDPGEDRNLAANPAHASTLFAFRLKMLDHLARTHAPETDGGPFPVDRWFDRGHIHPDMAKFA